MTVIKVLLYTVGQCNRLKLPRESYPVFLVPFLMFSSVYSWSEQQGSTGRPNVLMSLSAWLICNCWTPVTRHSGLNTPEVFYSGGLPCSSSSDPVNNTLSHLNMANLSVTHYKNAAHIVLVKYSGIVSDLPARMPWSDRQGLYNFISDHRSHQDLFGFRSGQSSEEFPGAIPVLPNWAGD